MRYSHSLGSAISAAIFAGAAAITLFVAPIAGAQPGACTTPDNAADGAPCQNTGPAPTPALAPTPPTNTGADSAGCIPGRACGTTDGAGGD